MKPYFQRGVALSALLALAVGGGCKVGSDYQKPNVESRLSESYKEVDEANKISQEVGADVSSWWSQIADPVLAELTREAVCGLPNDPNSGSLTLQEAMFRIQSARAALGSTSSNLLPQVAQDGGYAYQSYGGNTQNVFSTATSMSWELDVFGRIQRSIEAATADVEVQRELYRDAYVILVGDVAQAYVDARSYQEQIRIALWVNKVQEITEHYARANAVSGMYSHLELSRALGPLNATRASLDALESQYEQALNRLSILVGKTPGYVDGKMALSNDDVENMDRNALEKLFETWLKEITDMERQAWQAAAGCAGCTGEALEDAKAQLSDDVKAKVNAEIETKRYAILGARLKEILPTLTPETPDELLVGIPADLLRRRPDVRAAEQRIIAQNARVGVAVADLYPMFTLSGSFGLEANSFSNMFDSDAIAAGVGPAFRWNILNFGKYRFNIEAQRFVQEELIAAYRQTVLEAAEEVDNALVLHAKEKARYAKLELSTADYLYAVILAHSRYKEGTDTVQPLVEAQAGLLSSQNQYVQCTTNQSRAIIQLYRALGGDWDTYRCEENAAGTQYDANAEWERQRAESAARQAEREERYAHVSLETEESEAADEAVVENADFAIVADDELEASPELAEPIAASPEDAYADEAILIAE